MPVYNEEACICQVVDIWQTNLTRLNIDFRMIILNDGSSDATGEKLAAYAGNSRIMVINKSNSGHGPTILLGYRQAVEQAEWVFQVDSDDEMGAEHFENLWKVREGYAALFGFRSGRQQNMARKFISSVSRLAVRVLFAAGVRDVNTPYRLMRAALLKQIIEQIPADTFAPNVLISGLFVSSGRPVGNVPIPHVGRKTGQVSIVKWTLVRAVIKALIQTIFFRINSTRQARF